jgi:hypothetical protein
MPEFLKTETKTPEQLQAEADALVNQVKDYIYVNASYLSVSNWDLRLVFCERMPYGETVPRTAVVMPHSQAKALSQLLAKNVQKLEEAMGEIRWEPKDSKTRRVD